MSESYEYTPPEPPSWSIHLPIFLLALTFCLYLGAQLLESQAAGKNMHYQLQNSDKNITSVKAAEKQADEMTAKLADPLKQATALETQYNSLFSDLYDLAKDDEDAKKIVQKWKINRPQPAPEEKKEPMSIGK